MQFKILTRLLLENIKKNKPINSEPEEYDLGGPKDPRWDNDNWWEYPEILNTKLSPRNITPELSKTILDKRPENLFQKYPHIDPSMLFHKPDPTSSLGHQLLGNETTDEKTRSTLLNFAHDIYLDDPIRKAHKIDKKELENTFDSYADVHFHNNPNSDEFSPEFAHELMRLPIEERSAAEVFYQNLHKLPIGDPKFKFLKNQRQTVNSFNGPLSTQDFSESNINKIHPKVINHIINNAKESDTFMPILYNHTNLPDHIWEKSFNRPDIEVEQTNNSGLSSWEDIIQNNKHIKPHILKRIVSRMGLIENPNNHSLKLNEGLLQKINYHPNNTSEIADHIYDKIDKEYGVMNKKLSPEKIQDFIQNDLKKNMSQKNQFYAEQILTHPNMAEETMHYILDKLVPKNHKILEYFSQSKSKKSEKIDNKLFANIQNLRNSENPEKQKVGEESFHWLLNNFSHPDASLTLAKRVVENITNSPELVKKYAEELVDVLKVNGLPKNYIVNLYNSINTHKPQALTIPDEYGGKTRAHINDFLKDTK